MSVDESKQIALSYETDYEIDDEVFYEPFKVLRNVNASWPSWWNGRNGQRKVETLIKAFKTRRNVKQACINARISYDQYVYFCKIHPSFASLKARIESALTGEVKDGYTLDLMKPENAQLRERYLLRQEPNVYDPFAGSRVPDGAAVKLTAEAFLDADGNMIVSEQAAELIDQIENGDSQSKTE